MNFDVCFVSAEFCENLIKVCWNLSIGAGHTHALRLLRLLASFSSMFYYAKKNGHDVSATSSTLSMVIFIIIEQILLLFSKKRRSVTLKVLAAISVFTDGFLSHEQLSAVKYFFVK